VQSPASDPHFVGVGGTQSTSPAGPGQCLINATAISNPAVWNDCVGSGGGGISTVWAVPSYQAGINGASATGRNVPDIALPAAFDDICLGCADYGGVWINWSLIWGTSWSSPTYVAMQTEINQACNAKQWGIGTIYGAFAKSGYSDFVDVTKGNNLWQSPYAGSGSSYNATNAFDNVSGIGIPLGMQIAQTNCSAPAIRATHFTGGV
jgi:kumamolisin